MRAAHALRSTCILLAIAAVFACMLLPSAALGQQRPEVAYIFPPGGRAGTTVEVRLGGYDFTPDTQLFVLDQRIGLEVLGPPGEMLFPPPPHWFGPKARYKPFSIPREVSARLLLPEDMPAGAIQWQAANANGATVRGEFVVSRGPKEVLEATLESGQQTGTPRKLPALPVTVSGCLERKEEVDEYCFTATRSGPVTCRMPVHRFGHPVYPILTVSDSQGRCVAESADTERIGLVLTFAAKAGETYTLSMHDLDFRGDRSMVYRLTVECAPSVLAAVPAAGRRGTTGRVRFLGYGVATGKAELESVVREVPFPAAPDEDATEENVLFYQLETEFGTAAACRLGLSKIPERSEAGLAEQDSRRIYAPSAVTGVLEDPFQEDCY